MLMIGVLAGCQALQAIDPYEGWNTYSDPQGEFTLRYPADWTQTDATGEVQFWDSFDDGKNSVKMVLVKKEGVQEKAIENPTKTVQETQPVTLNGKEVTVTRGTSLGTPYQRYEYPFETFAFSITALFNDDTSEFRALATKVQESFKTLK